MDFTGNVTILHSDLHENNSDHGSCRDAVYSNITLSSSSTLLVYSIIVFVLYSLLQRRKALCQDCCFGGYCGLPVPINFINETKDRWVYCAAFGMLVNLFIFVVIHVSEGSANSVSAALVAAFTLFMSMVVLPLYFFALIASIHGPLEPLSHLIGLIYAILSFVTYMRPCAICIHYANSEPRGLEFLGTTTASAIVSCVPLCLCNGVLVVYFAVKGIYVLILRILKRPLPKQENIDHCFGYVRRLFSGSQTKSTTSIIKWYKWDPYFRYSVRLLSVFTVICIAIFEWSVQVAFSATYYFHELKYFLIDNAGFKWINAHEAVYKVLVMIGFIVPLISFALIIIPLMISLTTYRHNCKQLWRGDRSFIPQLKRQSPTVLLTNSAFLFGRQLAMAIWAWIFYTVTLFIVMTLLAVLIISMVFVDTVKSIVIDILLSLLLTFGVSTAIYFCQKLFVYVTFADKSVLVNNRRLFHLYTYLFLFYNSVSGLLTTLRRIIVSFTVPLFFLTRLDRPLVIHGLEFLDKGYISYLAYIQVEAAYTNPVLNVFVYLLMERIKIKLSVKTNDASPDTSYIDIRSSLLKSSAETINYNSSVQQHRVVALLDDVNRVDDDVTTDKLARRRWHLMYTLLRNPELIKLRKGFVSYTDAAASSS